MSATEYLDQLDALRAAGTPDTWQVMNGSDIATHAHQTGPGSYTWTGHLVARMDDWRDDSDQDKNDVPVEDDAALIAAAVNALPQLTAALRAVLAYCDDMDRAEFFPGLANTDAIRTRITAALSPADPMGPAPAMGQP